MAKTKQSKQKRKTSSTAKKNIGVLLPTDLWKKFRVHCLENDLQPGNLLSQLIEDYLKSKGKKKAI